MELLPGRSEEALEGARSVALCGGKVLMTPHQCHGQEMSFG